jgi:hypothetical protein
MIAIFHSLSSILNQSMRLFHQPGDLRPDRPPIQLSITRFLMADGYYIVPVSPTGVIESNR